MPRGGDRRVPCRARDCASQLPPMERCVMRRALMRLAERYRHGRLRGEPSLRHMEPEHLRLSPEGRVPEPQGERRHAPAPPKSARLWARLAGLPAGTDAHGAEREASGERLAVVARLPQPLLVAIADGPERCSETSASSPSPQGVRLAVRPLRRAPVLR